MKQGSFEELLKLAEKEMEGPYQLPKGWRWVRLGEVTKVNPSKSEVTNLPDSIEVSFVPMDAVNEETGQIINPGVRKLGEVRKGYTYFCEKDVLFAKITPCMENGKCAVARNLKNRLGFGSTEFHVIRPSGAILSEWIHLYLRQQSTRSEATKFFTGSVGQQRVPREFLEHLQIPLPPLSEQKRIVARIGELFSKIEKIAKLREEAKDLAKALIPSALHQVFSKVDEKGWKWVRLGEVLKEDRRMINPQDFPNKEFWLVTMDCIESDTGRLLKVIKSRGRNIKSAKYMLSLIHI